MGKMDNVNVLVAVLNEKRHGEVALKESKVF
jgi:hypothetical protein